MILDDLMVFLLRHSHCVPVVKRRKIGQNFTNPFHEEGPGQAALNHIKAAAAFEVTDLFKG